MARKLKLFNGRWQDRAHCYVAAYSMADAVRVVSEAIGYTPPGMLGEIKTYWSKDCWGTPMKGITPERGIWVQKDEQKPIRLKFRGQPVRP